MDPGFFLKGREGLQDNFWHDFIFKYLEKRGVHMDSEFFLKGRGLLLANFWHDFKFNIQILRNKWVHRPHTCRFRIFF